MNIRDTVSFFLQAATVGIVAAFLLLMFKPEWFAAGRSIIEVRHAPQHDIAIEPAKLPSGQPSSYADAVEHAAGAVVNVYTSKVITRKRHPLLDDPLFRHFFGEQADRPRKQTQTSLGSGVIVSPQGYVLTNNHVIAGADEIQVMLQDGRSTRATVVGVDKDTDLAVLRIKLDDLPAIAIGTSDNLRVGDVALAIGNPFGVGQTVTLGIISATGRNQLGINRYEDFIQTDAAINPGQFRWRTDQRLWRTDRHQHRYIQPLRRLAGHRLCHPRQPRRQRHEADYRTGPCRTGLAGYRGAGPDPLLAESFQLDDTHGMLIAGVLRDGPADSAGMEPGDVIETINGEEIDNARSAMSRIAQADRTPA